RVAQVRMRVHDADLAPEEGAALRALEKPLRAAAVRQGAVEQACSVRAPEVLAHDLEMRRGLFGRAKALEDGVHHGQQAVAHARLAVARVKQQLIRGARREDSIASDDTVGHQVSTEVVPDSDGPGLPDGGATRVAGSPHGPG